MHFKRMKEQKSYISKKNQAFSWLLLLVFSFIPLLETFHHHVNDAGVEKQSVFSGYQLSQKISYSNCTICDYMRTKETNHFEQLSDFAITVIESACLPQYFQTVSIYLSKDKRLFYGKSPPVI